MSKNINLVAVEKDEKVRQKHRIKIARIVSACFLGAVALASVGIFILSAFNPLPKILNNQKDAKRNLSLAQQKSAKLIVINGRLDGVSEINKKRKDYTRIVKIILQLMPQGTSINSLSIDNNNLGLSASSNSLNSINQLIDNIEALSVKKELLGNVDMDSLLTDPSGGAYSVSFKATLL